MEVAETEIDSLIREYRVNVHATSPVSLKRTRLPKGNRIYKVEYGSLNAYLVDTPMARRIACHPHIVGEQLERLTMEAAMNSLPAILELAQTDQQSNDVVFEQILRAAPGYQLHRAASQLVPGSFRTVYIRPRYAHESYRDHDGMVKRRLNIVYEDFGNLPAGRDILLIQQDTVASSRSAEVSIEAAISHCEKVGSRISKWVLYGFISLEGLTLLDKLARSRGIPLVAFAMGNLTALCANNYDMPLYGVDEWLWREKSAIHKIGALVDRTTFSEYLQEYVPGSDQPGDWSARQTKLFTGTVYESGDIAGHLQNSMLLITSLLKIGTFSDWQEQLAINELRMIEDLLSEVKS